MTARLSNEADRAIMDEAGEITDGLFAFCAQGEYVLDCAAYYGDDESQDRFEIDVYERKGKNRDLCNFTLIGNKSIDVEDLWTEYEAIACWILDTNEEMLKKFMELSKEYNHF